MMFGLFGKKGKGKSGDGQTPSSDTPKLSNMSDAKQQLFAQLKAKREELGPEEIAKMQKAVKLDALKKQMKNDIDNDPAKRQRLLDEIRITMQDD